MTTTSRDRLTWHRVLDLDELPDGRVKTVSAGPHSFAVTHYEGRYAALSNRCPHQGGPLGEGSIEKGMLRCPWHGYDYCPLDGSSPFGDGVATFPVEVRADGIYVGVEPDRPHATTVSDVMAETMVSWGVRLARDGGLADREWFGQLVHRRFALREAGQDRAARRVGERGKRQAELVGGHVTDQLINVPIKYHSAPERNSAKGVPTLSRRSAGSGVRRDLPSSSGALRSPGRQSRNARPAGKEDR